MTYVLGAVVLRPRGVLPPPGIDATAYADALYEDTYDVVDDLANVTAYEVPEGTTAAAALDRIDGTIGAVLAGDVPDLPGLLVGKLFGACEDRLAGVLPASDGTLVGLACRLPRPSWLDGADLDRADAVAWLHAAAPARSVVVGPGWHRLRAPADVARLDPRLEGWERTRALLSGYSSWT